MRALGLLLLLGCVEGPGWYEETPPASYSVFRRDVQPILERRCANPSCHGRPERALELFAPGQHRLDPATLHAAGAIGEEELRLNYWRASCFLLEGRAPERSIILTKPLAPQAGGSAHGGGAQFEDPAEPEYRALLEWARARTEERP